MSIALTPFGRKTHQVIKVENDVSGNPIYVAWCEPGTADAAEAHLIAKIEYLGGFVIRLHYAGGNLDYNSVWDDRASYIYS